VLAAVILGLWIATIPFPWLREFGRLEPAKMDFTQSTWISCWGEVEEGLERVERLLGAKGPVASEARGF
jgi:hypothetical protein